MKTIPREPTKEDIGWLSGILDGEGSITFSRQEKYPHIYYGVHFVNTNRELMEKINRIISEICRDLTDELPKISIPNYKAPIHIGKKVCHSITLRRQNWIIKVLEVLLPNLTEKRKKAAGLLNVLKNHKKGAWYTMEELKEAQWARRD